MACGRYKSSYLRIAVHVSKANQQIFPSSPPSLYSTHKLDSVRDVISPQEVNKLIIMGQPAAGADGIKIAPHATSKMKTERRALETHWKKCNVRLTSKAPIPIQFQICLP